MSTSPKVSICLPNLNTLPFLQERFDTLLNQTFTDWELLAYDSYSDDGAWEFIQEMAEKDGRIRAWQGPKEGTPGSWTPCLKEARGEYVYIATSDDTCALDFLEKTVAALDAHPECDLAHTTLKAIDEHGKDHPKNDWWRQSSLFGRSSGDLIDQPHVRMAPYDGLLHLMWSTVYISITQLLMRRSLFEKVGYFQQTWGWVGDFNWDMRAGLAGNTVHVPDTWGGWRNHSSQATGGNVYGSEEHDAKLELMIKDALDSCEKALDPEVARQVKDCWLPLAESHRHFLRGILSKDSFLERQAFLLQQLASGSKGAVDHLKAKFQGNGWRENGPRLMKEWLESQGKTVLKAI